MNITRLQATDWSIEGAAAPNKTISVSRTVWVSTDLGKREQTISIGYHCFSDGRHSPLLTIIADHRLIGDPPEGYSALEILVGGEAFAGFVMQVKQEAQYGVLFTDNAADHALFAACCASGDELWLRVSGPLGFSSEFPVPAASNFLSKLKDVAAIIRDKRQSND